MFGASLSTPVNSPHLRHSSSRTAVSELGSTEPVILNESFYDITEADLMKAGSSPKQALSTVASPDPLWRVKSTDQD